MAELQQSVHRCIRCIFVAHRDFIYVPDNTIEKAINNDHEPIFINFFTLPELSGHVPFYAIVCPDCEAFSIDYPHGYTGPDLLFLTCETCCLNLILLEDEIYERAGVKPPPTLLEVIFRLAKLRLMLFKSKLKSLSKIVYKKLKT